MLNPISLRGLLRMDRHEIGGGLKLNTNRASHVEFRLFLIGTLEISTINIFCMDVKHPSIVRPCGVLNKPRQIVLFKLKIIFPIRLLVVEEVSEISGCDDGA